MNVILNKSKILKFFFVPLFQKKNVYKILNYINLNIFKKNNYINTSKLNIWLKKISSQKQHPLIENRKVNFKYAVQIKESPITIKIFCNFPSKLKKEYKRFLTNNFNRNFKIINQKTVLIFSAVKNPYL